MFRTIQIAVSQEGEETMQRGTFLVIEGTDGSGKRTQIAKLVERLEREGYDVATFDFPQSEAASSYFVEQYVNGAYGSPESVGPYTASVFYALDHYQAAPAIRDALTAGKVVIANRFTGSNMANQGTSFDLSEHRRGYFIWLDNLEFEMFKIPRPDRSIVLRVPADLALGLVDEKSEADIDQLQRSIEVYDDMCQLFPRDFVRVDCARSNQLLDAGTVHNLLWQAVEPLLPPEPQQPRRTKEPIKTVATAVHESPDQLQEAVAAAKTEVTVTAEEVAEAEKTEVTTYFDQKDADGKFKYYTPDNFDTKTETTYRQIMDQIFILYADMVRQATTYIRAQSDTPKSEQDVAWQAATRAQAYEATRPVLPAAAKTGAEASLASARHDVADLAAKHLPETHTTQAEPLNLVNVWPRNELDLVSDMLYEHSNLSLKELQDIVAKWPIGQRTEVFTTYLKEQPGHHRPGRALEKAHYSWDLVCDYDTFSCLRGSGKVEDLEWQQLTPRYGYEIPKLVDDAGLTDLFEECFDLSLELYSFLQANGHALEAQYATLLGHKMRWKITYNAREAFHILELNGSEKHAGCRKLAEHMHEKLAEVHPLMAEAMKPAN